jgi:hypothetical protein
MLVVLPLSLQLKLTLSWQQQPPTVQQQHDQTAVNGSRR